MVNTAARGHLPLLRTGLILAAVLAATAAAIGRTLNGMWGGVVDLLDNGEQASAVITLTQSGKGLRGR